MRIAIFGATGQVGRRIVDEALSRDHEVTAIVRSAKPHRLPADALVRRGDASRVEDIKRLSQGQDIVINATRSAVSDVDEVRSISLAFDQALSGTSIRLFVIGGAASLKVPGADGRRVIDDPRYLPEAFRPVAQASLAQYELCVSQSSVDWTYLSPPAQLEPGRRTGQYRLGGDYLVTDETGRSRISIEDLAVVTLDEIMRAEYSQRRFTAAY